MDGRGQLTQLFERRKVSMGSRRGHEWAWSVDPVTGEEEDGYGVKKGSWMGVVS